MSTHPHLFRPRKVVTRSIRYPKFFPTSGRLPEPGPLFARDSENATILLVPQRPCNAFTNMVNVYLLCADWPPFLPLRKTTEE
jgi:hypothetical protein